MPSSDLPLMFGEIGEVNGAWADEPLALNSGSCSSRSAAYSRIVSSMRSEALRHLDPPAESGSYPPEKPARRARPSSSDSDD